jgi:hypothetical protein
MMEANLGHPPRTIVWPYGRYTGPALQVARELGFAFALTLEPEPAYTSDLHAIQRYFPTGRPSLGDIVRNLRFEPQRPLTRRIACVTLDALATAGSGRQQDEVLGHIIEGLRALGTNAVVIDANAALPSAAAPLGAVYFPTKLDVGQIMALAGGLRAEGWLRPDVSGRVAFSLPVEPEQQIEALRQAQRQGASAFALCPKAPMLPPSAALAAAFSAATYPYRP